MFFAKGHFLPQFFFEETPLPKNTCRKIWPKNIRTFFSTIFEETTLPRNVWKKSRPKDGKIISPKQKSLQRQSPPFFVEEIFSATICFKRHPYLEKFKKTHDQKISEEKTLPNKIFAKTFCAFFVLKKHFLAQFGSRDHFIQEKLSITIFFKRHPTKKYFFQKSYLKSIRKEISTKQTLCIDSLHHLRWRDIL